MAVLNYNICRGSTLVQHNGAVGLLIDGWFSDVSAATSIASFPEDDQADQQDVDEDQAETGDDKVETVAETRALREPLLIAILHGQDVVDELLQKVHQPADEGEESGQSCGHVTDE